MSTEREREREIDTIARVAPAHLSLIKSELTPSQVTSRHVTPRHVTPRHATPRHATRVWVQWWRWWTLCQTPVFAHATPHATHVCMQWLCTLCFSRGASCSRSKSWVAASRSTARLREPTTLTQARSTSPTERTAATPLSPTNAWPILLRRCRALTGTNTRQSTRRQPAAF